MAGQVVGPFDAVEDLDKEYMRELARKYVQEEVSAIGTDSMGLGEYLGGQYHAFDKLCQRGASGNTDAIHKADVWMDAFYDMVSAEVDGIFESLERKPSGEATADVPEVEEDEP